MLKYSLIGPNCPLNILRMISVETNIGMAKGRIKRVRQKDLNRISFCCTRSATANPPKKQVKVAKNAQIKVHKVTW
ncbi:hypothetical protein D3C73_1522740 [compost metagenome]